MSDLTKRLRDLGFTPMQVADAEANSALASAWLAALDNATNIYSPAGFVAAGIRSGQYPMGYSPAPTGQRARAAVADRDEALALPYEENRRRMEILQRGMVVGGLAPELLDKLYDGDPAGRLAHDWCARELEEHGETPDEHTVQRFMLDVNTESG